MAVRDCLWVGHRSFNCTFKNADSFEICNVIMICKAAEIILTLSATFKGSADQQSVVVKTDFTFLGHDNLFSQIYMTPPEGQTQVIARAQSISLIHCLFRLVKCKFTEPLYKSAWYTLLSLLIFSTYALSIKREGSNLMTKKKKKKEISRLLRLLHSSAVMLVNSAVLRYCGYRDSPIGDSLKQDSFNIKFTMIFFSCEFYFVTFMSSSL